MRDSAQPDLKPYPGVCRKNFNFSANSKHEFVNEKLGCNSYFCKPYHAWEKGTVENINGLIRRFFPKGTDFDTITDEDIIKMENWINNLPMKILGFKTPNEMALAA